METPQTEKEFWTKVIIYGTGTLLGLASKLAQAHKLQRMSKWEFIARSTAAFACAFFVWQTLQYSNNLALANVMSVFVGRYGDEVLWVGWKVIKEGIQKFKA